MIGNEQYWYTWRVRSRIMLLTFKGQLALCIVLATGAGGNVKKIKSFGTKGFYNFLKHYFV